MKLLVVCQYFYPEEFRLNDVCFNLVQKGHKVTILTGLPNYPQGEIFTGYGWEELEKIEKSGIKLQKTGLHYDKELNAYIENIHGVKVVRVNLRPRFNGKKNLAKNYLSFVQEGNKLAKSMAKLYKQDVENEYEDKSDYNFDKIIVFQYSPVTMALPAITFKKESGTDIPIYIYCFDLWPESIVSAGLSKSGPIYLSLKLLSKHIYSQAEEIWISSHNFENYFMKKLKLDITCNYLPIYAEQLFLRRKAKQEDLQVSHTENENEAGAGTEKNSAVSEIANGKNGLGTKTNSATSKIATNATSENNKNGKKVNFLFAGNIGEMQSVETILNAANLVLKRGYQPVLHIIGEGSSYNKIIDLAAALDLTSKNIIFYGQHPLREMPHFYDMADAFLVTLKNDEFISYTLPGKVQSYLAYGKPIVAAIDGEASRVITEARCGFVGPAEDYEALARNIIRFMDLSVSEREEYADLAKEYYEAHFSQKIFFENLDKLIE